MCWFGQALELATFGVTSNCISPGARTHAREHTHARNRARSGTHTNAQTRTPAPTRSHASTEARALARAHTHTHRHSHTGTHTATPTRRSRNAGLASRRARARARARARTRRVCLDAARRAADPRDDGRAPAHARAGVRSAVYSRYSRVLRGDLRTLEYSRRVYGTGELWSTVGLQYRATIQGTD